MTLFCVGVNPYPPSTPKYVTTAPRIRAWENSNMTQEAVDYIKALTEWYANEVKSVIDGTSAQDDPTSAGNPGSSGPPKKPT